MAFPESQLFEPLLAPLDERRRAEVVAAFMAVEHGAEPVPEVRFAALRDPELRSGLAHMLGLIGRELVPGSSGWTSGYRDDVAALLAPEEALPETERAVLTLVLIHSVAIPRAEGRLAADTWLSPIPAPVDELRGYSRLPVGEVESALRRLRAAGLVTQVKASDDAAGGYVPGPQFHRLTPAARSRLQEDLIIAAGPDTPLAAAVRAQRLGRSPAAPETTAGAPE